MDQIKELLPKIKQHSFWVMAIGILVMTLVSWWYSTGSLKADQEKQAADIKQKFDGVKNIRSANQLHPNDSVKAGMDDLIAKYAYEIEQGWNKQYEQQAKVLVWPPK